MSSREPGANLPPHVRAEVQRILNKAAQRIYEERRAAFLAGDPIDPKDDGKEPS